MNKPELPVLGALPARDLEGLEVTGCHGVCVTGTPGVLTEEVADTARALPRATAAPRAGRRREWHDAAAMAPRGPVPSRPPGRAVRLAGIRVRTVACSGQPPAPRAARRSGKEVR